MLSWKPSKGLLARLNRAQLNIFNHSTLGKKYDDKKIGNS